MHQRRILIVDNNDELRNILGEVLGNLGHQVVVTGDRGQALERKDLDDFDLIISDLTEEAESNGNISELQRKHLIVSVDPDSPDVIKAFKLGAGNYRRAAYDQQELREI